MYFLRSLTARKQALESPKNDRCYLLELPLELQLLIYRLAVTAQDVLVLNVPCNSSYRGRHKQMRVDEKAWEQRKVRPPPQPAITKTCRSIRTETLPLFYSLNVFRARYCDLFGTKPLPDVVQWLQQIGLENRETLKQLYFYDRNETQDANYPEQLLKLKTSVIFTEMNGTSECVSDANGCAHRVTFGDAAKQAGQGAMVQKLAPKALRLKGEE